MKEMPWETLARETKISLGVARGIWNIHKALKTCAGEGRFGRIDQPVDSKQEILGFLVETVKALKRKGNDEDIILIALFELSGRKRGITIERAIAYAKSLRRKPDVLDEFKRMALGQKIKTKPNLPVR